MATLTWLHLSDLHCRPKQTGWDANRILRALGQDLEELAAERGLRPDLLLFTGDAAFGHDPDRGLLIDGQFDAVKTLLEALGELCGLPKERVFIVPGNHDVDRTCIADADTAWLEEQRQQYKPQAIQALLNEGDANPRWRSVMNRLAAYRAFLKRAGYDHLIEGEDAERLVYVQRLEIGEIEVAIAGLNSAWSCHGDDEGRLWMGGDWQVARVEDELEGADLTLGLLHHPLNWIVSAEAPALGRYFERVFDFVLHGHEHQAWVTPLPHHVRVAAGACYEHSEKENGYNLVRLDFTSRTGEIWLRRYEKYSGRWQRREIRDRTDSRGVWPLKNLRCMESQGSPAGEPSTAAALVNEVFDTLERNRQHPIVLLLAQEGRSEREVFVEIRERARALPDTRVFHLTTSTNPAASLDTYFTRLARRCGFADDVSDPDDWMEAIEDILDQGQRIFLLVRGIEDGSAEGRNVLARTLRAISDGHEHGANLQIVLSGGENLAALHFNDVKASIFNVGTLISWPDPVVQDVLTWQNGIPGLTLSQKDCEEILTLCGGHRRLILRSLAARSKNEDEHQALIDDAAPTFTPYRDDRQKRAKICDWLRRSDLGPAEPSINDPLLRRLYWANALTVRDGRITWRCDLIREAGEQVFKCG